MKIIITIIKVNYRLILKDLRSEKEIRDVLVNVMDPEIHMNIIELNMVKKVTINDNNVEVIVALTVAGCPLAETIKKDGASKLSNFLVEKIFFLFISAGVSSSVTVSLSFN